MFQQKRHREIQKKFGQQQVQLYKEDTTCLSTIYVFQPMWNMKGEGGLGRTSWIKQQGRTMGKGLGLLRDIRVFDLILNNIPILLLWFNPFNTLN